VLCLPATMFAQYCSNMCSSGLHVLPCNKHMSGKL